MWPSVESKTMEFRRGATSLLGKSATNFEREGSFRERDCLKLVSTKDCLSRSVEVDQETNSFGERSKRPNAKL